MTRPRLLEARLAGLLWSRDAGMRVPPYALAGFHSAVEAARSRSASGPGDLTAG